MNNHNENGGGYFSSLTGIRRAVPVLLTALAVFIAVCFITSGTGLLGDGISSVLLGLFSYGAYAIPLLLIIHAFFYPEDYAKGLTLSRSIFSIITVLIVSSVEYTVVFWNTDVLFAPVEFYTTMSAGGFVGSIIAFGIIKVLGHIGILILDAAIIAIYITFFFTRGDGALSRLIISFVGFIANVLAAIERLVKRMIKNANDKKAAKLLEEEERRSRELLDDQFFAVDNGMRELKIGELGIHESRTQAAAEENPTLQNRVFHKSAAGGSQKRDEGTEHKIYGEPEAKAETAPHEEQPTYKERRPLDLTYGIKNSALQEIAPPKSEPVKNIQTEPDAASIKNRTSLDDSADSVFTKDFDPFDLAFAESAASKASSKAAPRAAKSGISELTTPLSAITEDDLLAHKRELENKKRIEEFEERKKKIIADMRASAAPAAPSTAPVTEISSSDGGDATANTPSPAENAPVSTAIHTAPINETAQSTSDANTKTVEFSFAPEQKPKAPTVSDSVSFVFEKPDFVTDETEEVAAHVAEIIERSVPGYTRSANKSYTYTKVTIPEEPAVSESEADAAVESVSCGESVHQANEHTQEEAEMASSYSEADAADGQEYTEAAPSYDTAVEQAPIYNALAEQTVSDEAAAEQIVAHGEDDEDEAAAYQGEEKAYEDEPRNIQDITEPTPVVKVISEYSTTDEEDHEQTNAEFRQFEISEPETAREARSTVEEPREELKIERTILSPTPDSSYSAINAARDAKYTVIDENMPVSEDKPEDEPATEDTIAWDTGNTVAHEADKEDGQDEGTTFVFEGDNAPKEENTDTTDDAENIFGATDENEIFELAGDEESEISEDEAEIKEIPVEEQNPVILQQQKMFPSIFGNTDDADEDYEEDKANGIADDGAEAAPELTGDEASPSDKITLTDGELEEGEGEDFSPENSLSPEELIATIRSVLDGEGEEDEPPFDTNSGEDEDTPSVQMNIPKKEEKPKQKKPDYSKYEFPPIDLLGVSEQISDENVQYEIQENADRLIDTLASFDVTASIKGVDRGPRITRYEVVPAKGVMVRRVLALENDIALNLAAESIRMEAPIPGKSAVGVEIPNRTSSTVRLRELLETEEFKSAKSKTTVCLGKDVAGQPMFADISKMPHALIAGATGMGKSVCINSLMISMLFKAKPDEVKFIMIDPKQVEFTMYNGIPHLLVPIVTDVKQAAGALMWAVEEMERRYTVFQECCVKNIDAYNEKVALKREIGDPMHRIIIVIDEFAELIMQVKNPVENLVIRIAQKARAAGIHLVIGTQKPVKEVITGLIKSNIPTKMSCKVLSNKDSMLMFDKVGAEKLLDKGDMLVSFPSSPKPMRVQGTFVNDDEVEAVMEHLKQFSGGANYDESVMDGIKRATDKCTKSEGGDSDGGSGDGGGEGFLNDRQFLEAVEVAVNSGKISTSLLQRRLSIGYGKAAKFIDVMCDMGIVGEPNGQKPRDVLISPDEWSEKLSRTMID